MKRGRAKTILGEVTSAVGHWARFADEAGLDADRATEIAATHRLELA